MRNNNCISYKRYILENVKDSPSSFYSTQQSLQKSFHHVSHEKTHLSGNLSFHFATCLHTCTHSRHVTEITNIPLGVAAAPRLLEHTWASCWPICLRMPTTKVIQQWDWHGPLWHLHFHFEKRGAVFISKVVTPSEYQSCWCMCSWVAYIELMVRYGPVSRA